MHIVEGKEHTRTEIAEDLVRRLEPDLATTLRLVERREEDDAEFKVRYFENAILDRAECHPTHVVRPQSEEGDVLALLLCVHEKQKSVNQANCATLAHPPNNAWGVQGCTPDGTEGMSWCAE